MKTFVLRSTVVLVALAAAWSLAAPVLAQSKAELAATSVSGKLVVATQKGIAKIEALVIKAEAKASAMREKGVDEAKVITYIEKSIHSGATLTDKVRNGLSKTETQGLAKLSKLSAPEATIEAFRATAEDGRDALDAAWAEAAAAMQTLKSEI